MACSKMSASAGAPSVVAEKDDLTMLVKIMCVYRAKYKLDGGPVYLHPYAVVPHPQNRGSDPLKSIRCRGLTADIAKYGCDIREAEQNAVAIQSPPDKDAEDAVLKMGINPDYDAHFASTVLDPADMCVKQGTPIEAGSAAHSHLNQTLRNILSMRVGCECHRVPVVAGGTEMKVTCTCGNARICDDKGRYCMHKIRDRDPNWEQLARRGLPWEILHWKVMLEQGAVITISNALNVKNASAMKIGNNEIFSYMCSLCHPHPKPTPFEPLRDELITRYGADAQDLNLQAAFRFIMEAGGPGSQTLEDYHQFLRLFCDPNIRRLGFDAYRVVNLLPEGLQNFKLALLYYAWKQQVSTKNIWLSPPPDFSPRLSPDAKVSWLPFLMEVEAALNHIRYFMIGNTPVGAGGASVVAETGAGVASVVAGDASDASKKGSLAQGAIKDKIREIVEIGSSIVASMHKAPVAKKKQEQEQHLKLLEDNLAIAIGRKIRRYYARFLFDCEGLTVTLKARMPEYQSPFNDGKQHRGFWTKIYASLMDDKNSALKDVETKSNSSSSAVVAAELVPVASKYDSRGRLQSTHETTTMSTKQIGVTEIPFQGWMRSKAVLSGPIEIAKQVLQLAKSTITIQLRQKDIPVRLVKKKGAISVVAEKDMRQGHLLVPLFFRRSTSIVERGVWGDDHSKSISVDIEWQDPNLTTEMVDKGIERAITHCIPLIVTQEIRPPNPGNESADWTGQEDVHPFWLIKRQTEGAAINCDIIHQKIEQATIMDWDDLRQHCGHIEGVGGLFGNNVPPQENIGGITFYVWYPFIVNKVDICAGDELVVWCTNKQKEKKADKRKEINAFDQIEMREKKRGKATQ